MIIRNQLAFIEVNFFCKLDNWGKKQPTSLDFILIADKLLIISLFAASYEEFIIEMSYCIDNLRLFQCSFANFGNILQEIEGTVDY
jgi:hypothetical protein